MRTVGGLPSQSKAVKRSFIALAFLGVLPMTVASGQDSEVTDWQQQKCTIYEQSWGEALEFFGSDNINYNFIASNENFIAGGCTERVNACPRSSQEREIADALTIAMMNAGTASTFLPFTCASTQ